MDDELKGAMNASMCGELEVNCAALHYACPKSNFLTKSVFEADSLDKFNYGG